MKMTKQQRNGAKQMNEQTNIKVSSAIRPKMTGLDKIKELRAYCDYVDEHLNNVAEAWIILQKSCKHEKQVWNDFDFMFTHTLIEEHDLSKLGSAEFVQYAEWFYGSHGVQYDIWDDGGLSDIKHSEAKKAFDAAWEHHKVNNPHHWQNWAQAKESFPGEASCHLMCMVADWMAMGIKFGDTAEEYYEREKDNIKLPEWAVEQLRRVFKALEAYSNNGEEQSE